MSARSRIEKYVAQLGRNSYLTRGALRDVQREKFKKLIKEVYRTVPFYRDHFDRADFDPYKAKSFEDFQQLPILTKDMVRSHFPEGMVSREADVNRCTIASTSGSTGEPLQYMVSPKDHGIRTAINEHGNAFFGCTYHDQLIHFMTIDTQNKNRVYGQRRRCIISPYADLCYITEMIEKMKPTFIKGSPSLLYTLGRDMLAASFRFPRPLKGVATYGEVLSPVLRQGLKTFFDAPVFDLYGCREVMNIACECHMHNGMHEVMEHVYVELLKDGKPVLDGEMGRIIVTDLDNYTMPFIRYDTGDYGRRSTAFCACDRQTTLIESIDGRVQDFLLSQDERIVSPFVFTGFISPFYSEPLLSIVKQYQVIQKTKETIAISLQLHRDKNLNGESRNAITNFTREQLGDVQVFINVVDEIETTKRGKVSVVISEISPDVIESLLHTHTGTDTVRSGSRV